MQPNAELIVMPNVNVINEILIAELSFIHFFVLRSIFLIFLHFYHELLSLLFAPKNSFFE